jgi:hypothetical protein
MKVSSGMLHRVVWQMFTDVSVVLTVSIIRAILLNDRSHLLICLVYELKTFVPVSLTVYVLFSFYSLSPNLQRAISSVPCTRLRILQFQHNP